MNCVILITITIVIGAVTANVQPLLHQQQQQVESHVVATISPLLKTVIGGWHANFTPPKLEVHMGTSAVVLLNITNVDATAELQHSVFVVRSANEHIARVNNIRIPADQIDPVTRTWSGNITVETLFLGASHVFVELVNELSNATERSDTVLEVIVTRRMRVIDHVFTGSVALLVSLLYINFGAALDVSLMRGIITRPIGPVIGFLTQFIIMPLLSFGLGYCIFPNAPEMQLGLFFTGVSPSGGASNIWAVILGGNINLSVLMTAVSNFAAFAMMPLWLFTLGQVIFERGNMTVPYANIASYAVALIVPLAIGLAIQKWSPRLTRILVRMLKPISAGLIIFIIIFAIVTNLYIFELFSWQIIVAGLALPWLGYVLGWICARLLRQNSVDALTIAIETGIQNTGISIFLLRFSLPQPQADLTTVIPVAVAIMTPIPLLCIYIYKRFTGSTIKNGLTEQQYIDNDEEHNS